MDPEQEYEIFVGSSQRLAPDEPPSLERGIEDAYERAKNSGHKRFRVAEIVVVGDNPINDYRVALRPAP